MKRLTIPLASYLAVTIVVPILNRTPLDSAFLDHAILTITLTLIITGTLSPLLSSRNRTRPAAKIAAPDPPTRCDLCLRTAVKSGACLPGECPRLSTPE
jgi:hypothetical protein